ncbi:ABC transporter ATP-binding protein [Geoglobus acetivorans]|uniref:Iron-sulfur cluster assembly ATPase protein SufC n=1 Tax=Geoglobus acetivorans TaxID=565033 RepID=A0A0A7GGH1_GEOAI|nr:Iron-sulfur cluster assembly ATPase protein SufC [Geoglobus acetivorans]
MDKDMLRVVNLGVKVGERKVLTNINLYIKRGETLALFGPNGSGKSTLMNTLIGNPNYRVFDGRIVFKGRDITEKDTDYRANLGMGIAFQTPPAINGVKLIDVLKKIAEKRGIPEERIYEYAEYLNMSDFLDRDINRGFSGGEVKRSELLQLLVMDPDFIMLDEPDSGVDIENVALVGEAIRKLLQREVPKEERRKSGIIITHTGNILDYVDADYGVILYRGKLACIGNPYEILDDVRKYGYEGCVKKCLREFQNLNQTK